MTLFRIRGKQNPAYDPTFHDHFAPPTVKDVAMTQNADRTGDASALRARVAENLDRLAPRLRALSLDLHRQPELGCEEIHAVARLAGELEEEGLRVETGLGGLPTAFRAATPSRPGPAVAFLAEYDAVPDLGHACGHNLLCAASHGAAVALARLGDQLPGRVLVVGAPGEETIGGKIVLAERGVFDDVDAALLAHPGPVDCVTVRTLASWSMEVVFEGRPAHAVAAPGRGVDALAAMIRLFNARDRLVEESGGEVLIPGVILEGGVRPNLVPGRARARFSLRAPTSLRLVEDVAPRFRAAAEAIAREAGARVSIEPVDNLYDEMNSNPVLAEIYAAQAKRAGLKPRATPGELVGSLDAGALSQRIPTLHPIFGIGDGPLATHTPEFAAQAATPQALDAARRAALALAWTALEIFLDPLVLERARGAQRPRSPSARAIAGAPLVLGARGA